MSDNWVVQNLENALETWNEKSSVHRHYQNKRQHRDK